MAQLLAIGSTQMVQVDEGGIIWKGVGALINSSQTNVGASCSLGGPNKKKPFTQFSSPIDVAEKEVGSEEL